MLFLAISSNDFSNHIKSNCIVIKKSIINIFIPNILHNSNHFVKCSTGHFSMLNVILGQLPIAEPQDNHRPTDLCSLLCQGDEPANHSGELAAFSPEGFHAGYLSLRESDSPA
jgi:hypothetical protein